MAIATTTEWNLRTRQRRALHELRDLLRENVMRGTVVSTTRRCGKPRCACATDETKRHPRQVVTVRLDGRTRTMHLDAEHAKGVVRATRRYLRLWALLDELTEVNLKLLAFPVPPDSGA
jgi:hypothetical protein